MSDHLCLVCGAMLDDCETEGGLCEACARNASDMSGLDDDECEDGGCE